MIITAPIDGAIDITPIQDIVLTFDEAINIATFTYSCIPDPGGWGIAWGGGNTIATLSHANFADQTLYTFVITGGTDMAGNGFTSSVPNPFTFTTGDFTAPSVSSTTPADMATGVAIAAGTYVIHFNEPMNSGLGTVTTNLPGIVWVWSADEMWLNGTYNALAESMTYNVDLSAGGFEDTVGNALIAGGYGWTFDFTTAGENPWISTTMPVNGLTGYGLTPGDYVIQFSEPMNTGFGTVTSDLPGVDECEYPDCSYCNYSGC